MDGILRHSCVPSGFRPLLGHELALQLCLRPALWLAQGQQLARRLAIANVEAANATLLPVTYDHPDLTTRTEPGVTVTVRPLALALGQNA